MKGWIDIIILPSYDSDEVKVFHPLCQLALNNALKELKLTEDLEVLHHEAVGSIIPDFVLVRKNTKKYLMFIEVKRTPNAVSSTRYRLQAQSYVQEAMAQNKMEKTYYLLTNLEVSDLFKYDQKRPSVLQQQIEPSTLSNGTFQDNPEDFLKSLTENFKKILKVVINNKSEYKELTTTFYPLLKENINNQEKWHQNIMVGSYEYIKGVFKSSNRNVKWKPAIYYKDRPEKISDEISKINFNALSKAPLPDSSNSSIWNPAMLEDLEKMGRKNGNGDALSNLIHSIAIEGKEHEGVVPTDLELANILSIFSKFILKRELTPSEIVCDPAAGSGNLLSILNYNFENIQPNQIWANDWEILFSELLTLRLGLIFPDIVSKEMSSLVTTKNITELTKNDFNNVKLILMNPPYVSGVKDIQRKTKIAERIYDITGVKSKTFKGQIGLEAPFLELVNVLAKDDTVIAVIFPKQYLKNPGNEAATLRKFLLEDFGLNLIFTYPRQGIFKKVTKDTVILIGTKNSSNRNSIRVINSTNVIENLNISDLKENLNAINRGEVANLDVNGITDNLIPLNKFHENEKDGWKFLNDEEIELQNWLLDLKKHLIEIPKETFKFKRGRVGNSGGSDLLFINSNKDLWNKVSHLVPKEWLFPAIRRVDELDSPFLNSDTTKSKFLAPSDDAFIEGTKNFILLNNIIDVYLSTENSSGKQKKAEKTKEKIIKTLMQEKEKVTSSNTVLIPRSLRKNARVFLTEEPAYISTNLVEVSSFNTNNQMLLLAWLRSSFAQLQFEEMAKDQEGTRKLEATSIKKIYIPNFENISDSLVEDIINCSRKKLDFLSFDNPKNNDLDKKWAQLFSNDIIFTPKEEFSDSINIIANNLLEESLELLKDVAYRRQK